VHDDERRDGKARHVARGMPQADGQKHQNPPRAGGGWNRRMLRDRVAGRRGTAGKRRRKPASLCGKCRSPASERTDARQCRVSRRRR
jgi:hypothetical protein